jgi:hypothetical protein
VCNWTKGRQFCPALTCALKTGELSSFLQKNETEKNKHSSLYQQSWKLHLSNQSPSEPTRSYSQGTKTLSLELADGSYCRPDTRLKKEDP